MGGDGGQVKHVVVLMLENRSFDHMVGYLKRLNPQIDGLSGTESNPYDPADPSKGSVTVSDDPSYITSPDPSHSISGTTLEIFGSEDGPQNDPPPMDGFVLSYKEKAGAPNNGADVMRCFAPHEVPVVSTLAMQYCLFDQWHASIPGPTQPNRMYAHSATSDGAGTNDDLHLALGYPQNTIYNNIAESGNTFGIYYSDFPATLVMRQLRAPKYLKCVHQMDKFYDDCKNGTLPTYSFLEPRWFKFLDWNASDQHPPHDVQLGEYFMADVYEAMRNSPIWEDCALIITYDEHGGLYDHVPTPMDGVPNPDGKNSTDPPFDFTRLGIRVPTILISPWVARGSVVSDPPATDKPQSTSCYEHSSLAATMKELLGLPQFLTQRDAWAATFTDVLSGNARSKRDGSLLYRLDAPRRDCPVKLPRPGSRQMQEHWRTWQARAVTEELIAEGERRGMQSNDPITDLQREVLAIAVGCTGSDVDLDSITTEHEGALFVREQMRKLMAQHGLPLPR